MSCSSSSSSSGTSAAEATTADNSDKIESVYPGIREYYIQNPSLEYFLTAQDRTRRFFDVMTEGNPVTKITDGIYRVMPSDWGQEYMYRHERWLANDYIGKEANWSWVNGKVEVPKANMEWVTDEDKILATSIDRTETKYTVEYNQKNLEEILPRLHNSTQYHIDTGSMRYAITRDLFFNDSFDDVIEFLTTGHRQQRKLMKWHLAEKSKWRR